MPDGEKFAGWAVLELMGHRRLAGYVQEVELAGQGMLRLDIPDEVPATDGEQTGYAPIATQFYSPGSVYCLTPCTEDAARAVAARSYVRPPAMLGLPAPVTVKMAPTDNCHRCEHPRSVHEDVDSGECRVRGCDCVSYLADPYDDEHDPDDRDDDVPF